ncbi:hypothetical protein BpHYR1_054663, partial [Brachionus plicatilis]
LLLERDISKARKGKIKLEPFALKQTGEFDKLANEPGMAQEDLILFFSHTLKPKCALELINSPIKWLTGTKPNSSLQNHLDM